MRFWVGSQAPNWLWDQPHINWFVSRRRLDRQKTYKPATTDWALDSGGFTELDKYGRWTLTAADYRDRIDRYVNEIGRLQWCAPQDWMCEDFMLAKTGHTVAEHQQLTIDNFLELRSIHTAAPVIPVLQGSTADDYYRHVDAYLARGVDLTAEPLVGVGSVCRRANVEPVVDMIRDLGTSMRLHGFGVKVTGLRAFGSFLASADSMAWSFRARKAGVKLCDSEHCAARCNQCPVWATTWATRIEQELTERTS